MIFKNQDIITLAETGEYDILIHGCNCFVTMGAGVAKLVKERFPKAFWVDAQTRKGDRSKLGTTSFISCPIDEHKSITVVNAYTQYNYGRNGNFFRPYAFETCLEEVIFHFDNTHSILMPKIGCGLAGGKEKDFYSIVEKTLEQNSYLVTVSYV